MNMFLKRNHGQSIIEYIALVLITSAAVSAMAFYVQRKIEIRTRHLNQELNEASRGGGQI